MIEVLVEVQAGSRDKRLYDEETDHKVLVTLPDQSTDLSRELHEKLSSFIRGVFRAIPDTAVQVGRILPREMVLEYFKEHRSE